mmetsp:Transcript_5163/g.11389  ORF Transcript_5163/g.11389 Transcript_5163/m.11389 type:complete len:146 (-) Transcript_5163:308-745(-)
MNIWATKLDPDSNGIGLRSEDGDVIVALMVTPHSASRSKKGQGYRIYRAEVPGDWSAPSAYEATPDDAKETLVSDSAGQFMDVRYLQNRIAVWPARRVWRTEWDRTKWRGGYKHRRMDLFFQFGEEQQRQTPQQQVDSGIVYKSR